MDKPILMNLQLFAEEGVVDTPVEPAETETTEVDNFDAEWNAQFSDEESTEESDSELEGESQEPEFDYKPFLDKLDPKYNGEAYKYETIEQLITDAQMGKNYGTLKEKYEAQKNNPLNNWAKSYMEQSGYKDPAKFLEAVKQSEFDSQVDNMVKDMINQGWDEQQARLYASTELKNKQLESRTQSTQQNTQRISEVQKFAEFFKQQSGEELTEGNIPDYIREIYDVNGNKTTSEQLELAYFRNNIDNLKAKTEQETIKKISDKRKISTGSVKSELDSNATMTPEQIEKVLSTMSPDKQAAWIDKNETLINRSGYFTGGF